jgi:YrbI family 3-deoxy-D-manno-octulosonate 8-phosphate phosphatase
MSQLVISDVDGVLTDSKINIGPNGEIFKSFSVKDGYGIVDWRKKEGCKFAIISSRESDIVENRASELGVEEVHQGLENKKEKVLQLVSRLNFDTKNTVYIGDDLSDINAMEAVGIACCPLDAVQEVQEKCSYVSSYAGGEGAVRDILNHLQK